MRRASSLSAGSRFFGFLLTTLAAAFAARERRDPSSRSPSSLTPIAPLPRSVPLFPPQVNGVPGYYTSEPYCGPITCLIALFVFPFVCCCPCDTKQEFVPLPAQQYATMAPQMQQMQPQMQQMPPQYGQPQPQYYPPTK